jgi:hypothetical protein
MVINIIFQVDWVIAQLYFYMIATGAKPIIVTILNMMEIVSEYGIVQRVRLVLESIIIREQLKKIRVATYTCSLVFA